MYYQDKEKVRLLLMTNEENQSAKSPTGRRISHGILSVMMKGPLYVLSLLPIVLFISGLISFVIFSAYILLVWQSELREKPPLKGALESTIPGSDFCKSVNAENLSLVALGYITGKKDSFENLESKNKIYYIMDRKFTDQEACAVEAALRLFQDKAIYVIEIKDTESPNGTTDNKTDFIHLLREQYTNLNRIKSNPTTFFRGSPFQNYLKIIDDFSIFAAKVLLVWQFGGTVLSPNFLIRNRKLYDNNEGFCEVDRELLFCPDQCSAYVYQLIKTVLDLCKKNETKDGSDESIQEIVDKSVEDYCGSKAESHIGCIGINRIKNSSVCVKVENECDFLRIDQWKRKSPNWRKVINMFCPQIVKHALPEITRTTKP